MRNYLITRNFFDDAFESLFFKSVYGSCENMKTDIKEMDDRYEMAIEIPGFDKEDLAIELEKGYLNISAKKEEKQEENKEDNGKYIFRERKVYYSRSYYVGEAKEENIKAKYENGILSIVIPKKTEEEKSNNKIQIA